MDYDVGNQTNDTYPVYAEEDFADYADKEEVRCTMYLV
jgi:hypothetical protein